MPPSQPVEGFKILVARAIRDILWQAGCRRLLVPANGFEIIADELFIEGGLCAAGLPRAGIPETRGVRRQYLVGEDDLLSHRSKLEFRVCKNEPARLGMCCSFGVDRKGEPPQLGGLCGPDARFNFRIRDVLVMRPILALGRRG